MTRAIAIRYPDGSIHIPVGFADPSAQTVACGTDIICPGDADYEYYAAHAVPVEELQKQPERDPERAAALKAEFRRRYRRDHRGRSA
ncbi:hypothetical protein CDO52_15365 [Nocardiopsis gilva YIM 90087]|uniref:Uncharacterized protein n=1 Tax=Nocardiopsis gilva YIM 90087 TaxID=1235441 RepID=A0A223S7A8_9ACTN|nr:hypothetical protein [Nocardiopsis gilva]ASU83979.1 hypothetical protein CDO52_15365 [Nocardiopsis gilva YIM 90087]